MAQDKIRKRRFAYKVKSGCKTCKRRRVKCDEQRPKCSRCKSSGRICEGFDTIRIAQTNTSNDGSLSLNWLQPLSMQPDATISETLAFKYFQYSCGAIVHNKFKYRPLFEYILQSAQVEPSVWHASVALGSLQQPENAPAAGDTVFGFHQYGKAVKLLNQRLHCDANVDSKTVLATSLLFATFEVLHKDFAKGSQHVNGSLNYLCDLVQMGALHDGVISSSFVDVFARLAISGSIFGGPSTRLSIDPFEWLASNLTSQRKFSMELAGHAVLFCLASMRSLEDIWQTKHPAGNDKHDPEDRTAELRKQLLSAIKSWQASMEELERHQSDGATRQRARLLKIYITYCRISVSTLQSSTDEATELRYDAYVSDFWNLLALCQVFLDCGDLETHEQGGLRYPSFTIHIGIIHILWYITIKCRHPGIRREALRLLKHCHHGEGDTYDGAMIAGYAEMVMRLEEGSEGAVFAEDVQLETRISYPYFNTKLDDHVLHCEKGDFRLGEEWSKQQPICVFSV